MTETTNERLSSENFPSLSLIVEIKIDIDKNSNLHTDHQTKEEKESTEVSNSTAGT